MRGPSTPARRRSPQLALLILLVTAAPAAPPMPFTGGRDVIVAADASAGRPGTCAAPVSLTAVLAGKAGVQPGDRVWLRGGVYRGAFTSRLAGTAAAPIQVRGYPGERAVIDNRETRRDAITVLGRWSQWSDFEITNSDPRRTSAVAGPWPDDLARGFGMFVRAPHVAVSSLLIHDLGNGIGLWEDAEHSSASDNLVFYNGWQGPDRAHGHGIYTQNRRGERLLAGNIVFSQFSHGIHAYGSARVFLDHMRLRDNILFNNGVIGRDGFARDILVGGGQPVRDLQVTNNNTYGGAQTALGYGLGCLDAWMTGNYLVGRPPLILDDCSPRMHENTLVGETATLGGLDDSNRLVATRPDRNVIRLLPSRTLRGRAHIVVYNWERASSATLDLRASGLEDGDLFEVRDAQNFDGPPVTSGAYTGDPVTLPLTTRSPRQPVGEVPSAPPSTAPEFHTFVVVPVRSRHVALPPCGPASEVVP